MIVKMKSFSLGILVLFIFAILTQGIGCEVTFADNAENEVFIVPVSVDTGVSNRPTRRYTPQYQANEISIAYNDNVNEEDYPEGYLKDLMYLKFDITNIKERIFSATLHITYRQTDMTPKVGVYGIDDDSWSEETLVWDNQPEFSSQNLLQERDMQAHDDYALDEEGFDVTSFIQEQQFNNGFGTLILEKFTARGSTFNIRSSKYLDGAYGAYLRIETAPIEKVQIQVIENSVVSNRYDQYNVPQYGGGEFSILNIPDTNYPENNNMRTNLGYLKFDIQDLQDRAIAAATLHITYKQQNMTPRVAVYGIEDDSWDEQTITWENQPDFASAVELDLKVVPEHQDFALHTEGFDVTSFVKEQQVGNGLVSLIIEKVSHRGNTFAFRSKEYSGGSAAPYLEIKFEPEPKLSVSRPKIIDEYGNEVLGISSGDNLTIFADVFNTTEQSKDITLIIVLYDGSNILKDITYARESFSQSSMGKLSVNYELPQNIAADYYLMAFVWDDLFERYPLSDEIIIYAE